MGIKVKTSGVQSKEFEQEVTKAVMPVQGSDFALEDSTDLVERREVKPRLITALMDPVANTETFTTNTFVYDEINYGNALPSGKAFSGFGPRVQKDKPFKARWEIGSFGISGNVAPQDYINRRKAGSRDFLTEADVLNQVTDKMGDAWDLFKEQQYVHLITTDTNLVAGGPFEAYDFYAQIVGGSRSAASIDFSSGTTDVIKQIRAQKKLLEQEALRAGEPDVSVVCLCGGNFFDARLEEERKEDLARPLRSTVDLASMQVGSVSDGSFRFDNFTGSQDGVEYIQYTGDIGGVAIGADDAYMIPVRANNFIKIGYAPAQTREYANTEALEMYSWNNVSDRQGVTVWEESNYLTAMTNPRLMRKMVAA